MVVATAAATAVGFWLSHDGQHSFAMHAGLPRDRQAAVRPFGVPGALPSSS
jgi:hypothetical protein